MVVVPADTLLRWCTTTGVPRLWMSDKVWHFNNRMFRFVAGALSTSHRVAIENSPWIRVTVRFMMREKAPTYKANMNDKRRPFGKMGAAGVGGKKASSAGSRERCKVCPCFVGLGFKLGRRPFATLAGHEEDDWTMWMLNPARVQA